MAEHCIPAHDSIRTDLTAPHGIVLVIVNAMGAI
jgi:hypothetical protein